MKHGTHFDGWIELFGHVQHVTRAVKLLLARVDQIRNLFDARECLADQRVVFVLGLRVLLQRLQQQHVARNTIFGKR